jgi:hypothetical protein
MAYFAGGSAVRTFYIRVSAIAIAAIGILAGLLCSCASAGTAPQWTADVSSVYPNEKYIAQRGYGDSRQSAELAGLAAISQYFSAHINTGMRELITVTDEGSASSLNSETFVQSQTKLFAVRYAAPWYNKSANQWETVAYIDRDEAWKIFEPELRQKADAFNAMYQEAGLQDEAFTKILLYTKALNLASREKIASLLGFADILYPQITVSFDDTRSMISAIPANIEKLKSLSVIYIECDTDFDSTIYTALGSAFSSRGFPVAKNKASAAYICTALVAENIRKLDAGTFYYPTVTVNVSGKDGVIFTHSVTMNRVGASNADVAKRRAYTAISNEIQKSFFE